jgi:hypothetical protein
MNPCDEENPKAGILGEALLSQQASTMSFLSRIGRYAETGKLHAPKQVNGEGDGFSAIKHDCGLRAYFWLDGSKMLISHFVMKKRDGLAPGDKARMARTRKKYQEEGRADGNRYLEELA